MCVRATRLSVHAGCVRSTFGLQCDWLRQINNFRDRIDRRVGHTEPSIFISLLPGVELTQCSHLCRIYLVMNTDSVYSICFASPLCSVNRLYKLRWIHNWLCFCMCIKCATCITMTKAVAAMAAAFDCIRSERKIKQTLLITVFTESHRKFRSLATPAPSTSHRI